MSVLQGRLKALTESFREKYRRFRAWQVDPFDYEMPDAKHRCENCGYEFTGNYCPRCSQKAGIGAMTWKSVSESVMEIWGVGSRSMTYTLFQLFTRPGYLIRDYVTGKRQVSFPPVKMLIIVAFIFTLAATLFFPESPDPAKPAVDSDAIGVFIDWAADNMGWGFLALRSFFIVPTWVLFRFAPRLPNHTLPQGFFIQVFMCVQTVVILFLSETLFFILLAVIYIWTYMQLFGYGLWGTIWRSILCSISAMMTAALIVYITVRTNSNVEGWQTLGKYVSVILFFSLGILAPLAIGYGIDSRIQKKRMKREENLS
ncbi:MAG: DUF3667 domain-containing protein [Prevotella sp.]|nr:DUF3667 domain-containing protein [Prevotella sp.]